MLFIASGDVSTGNTYNGTWNLSQNVNGNKTLINYYLENVAVDWMNTGNYLGVKFYMPGVTIGGQNPQAQYTVNFTQSSSNVPATIATQFQSDFQQATLESSQQLTTLNDYILMSDTTVTYDSVDGLYSINFTLLDSTYDVYITLQYNTDCNCTNTLGVSSAADSELRLGDLNPSSGSFEWVIANGEIGNNDPQYLYLYFNNVTSSISTTSDTSPTLILNRWSVISGETMKINGQVKSFDIYFTVPWNPTIVNEFVGSWSLMFS